jgi:hypothetical protein
VFGSQETNNVTGNESTVQSLQSVFGSANSDRRANHASWKQQL